MVSFLSISNTTVRYQPQSGHCAEPACRCKIRRRSKENEYADALESLNNMFGTKYVVFIAEEGYGTAARLRETDRS